MSRRMITYRVTICGESDSESLTATTRICVDRSDPPSLWREIKAAAHDLEELYGIPFRMKKIEEVYKTGCREIVI